ncbi:hypothetical protein GCM10028807_13810 [Spirosoma daeguense]
MKRRSLAYIQLFLFGLLVVACVTEFQPGTVSILPSLIVEGQITNQPGPYSVRLTQTADYSFKSINLLETGATVTIEDNLGNRETLTEQAPGGVYLTKVNGIRGVAGRSYKLTILTKAGKRYESVQEVLPQPPPILKLYYEYTNTLEGIIPSRRQGWNVYIDAKDPDTLGNYYKWSWTHYEPIEVCFQRELPDGLITGLNCCTPCWDIHRCYDCINLNSDANINGRAISRQPIMTVPYKSTRSYYLEVEQQALSKGAYAFWKSVRQLTSNTGGLFDAAPSSVQGNIRCVNDPSTTAYGYFGATGVVEEHMYVDRSAGQGIPDLDREVFVPQPSPCVACENSIYRTQNKPRWWIQ